MGAVLHAGGWRVEPTWCDLDDRGERMWHRVTPPWGGEMWCTTSQLQDLLHRHGLDVGDLTAAERPKPRRRVPVVEPDDGCE